MNQLLIPDVRGVPTADRRKLVLSSCFEKTNWPADVAGADCGTTRTNLLVHQRPERISVQLLAALCDIFGCGVEDLITVTATDVRRKTASATARTQSAQNVVELNKSVRPRRARVIRDDD